jgi:hypothetical protein
VAGVVWVFTLAPYQEVMRAAGEPLADEDLEVRDATQAPPLERSA